MRKNIDLSAEEYSEIVDSFYTYFENGYKFEEFLKVYLEKIGLEEVFVTKKSGDGGIDLTAVRKGIGGLSNSVDELFYIQAKRYSPGTTVSPEKIRALRGSFRSGVGMFITTGKVSDNAKLEAQQVDPSRPIIVVDGKELISTCIEKEIGFKINAAVRNKIQRTGITLMDVYLSICTFVFKINLFFASVKSDIVDVNTNNNTENAIFRTSVLWDMLAQLYNIKYKNNQHPEKVYYTTLFHNEAQGKHPNSFASDVYLYLSEIENEEHIYGEGETWKGNHKYVTDYRNKMTHRNSPNIATASNYDFELRMPMRYVLKRSIEDYVQASKFISQFIDVLLVEMQEGND